MLKVPGTFCAALVLAAAVFSTSVEARGGAHFGGGGAHFSGARVGGAHFSGARVGGARFSGVRVGGARVAGVGRYYGGGYRGNYYGGGWGYGLAAGAIAGGLLAASPYYGGYYGGYGPYAYDDDSYAYAGACYIRRHWVIDGYGRRVLRRVRVCY